MSAFENYVKFMIAEALSNISSPVKIKRNTWIKVFVYKCLKDHNYTWKAQDINNGNKHNFKAGCEYQFRESPDNLMYVVNHPENFELVGEFTKKV